MPSASSSAMTRGAAAPAPARAGPLHRVEQARRRSRSRCPRRAACAAARGRRPGRGGRSPPGVRWCPPGFASRSTGSPGARSSSAAPGRGRSGARPGPAPLPTPSGSARGNAARRTLSRSELRAGARRRAGSGAILASLPLEARQIHDGMRDARRDAGPVSACRPRVSGPAGGGRSCGRSPGNGSLSLAYDSVSDAYGPRPVAPPGRAAVPCRQPFSTRALRAARPTEEETLCQQPIACSRDSPP